MEAEEYSEIEKIFNECMGVSEKEREEILKRLRKDNPRLCKQVESLLNHASSRDSIPDDVSPFVLESDSGRKSKKNPGLWGSPVQNLDKDVSAQGAEQNVKGVHGEQVKEAENNWGDKDHQRRESLGEPAAPQFARNSRREKHGR